MARYTGPKHRLARREGINILEKTSRTLERRLNMLPGVHGKKGRRKPSEYGIQLREKQKLKRIYGLLEKQFSRYVQEAAKSRENTEEKLIQLLERRLDNVVYRLGYAKSRFMARQLVSHRHIMVDGKRINIPSFSVPEGAVFTLSDKLLKNEVYKKELENVDGIPAFVERKGLVGKFSRLPVRDEVVNPVDYQLVIEYYSR